QLQEKDDGGDDGEKRPPVSHAGQALAQPAHAEGGQGEGDHADADGGDFGQFDVVILKQCDVVAREKPAVLDLRAGIVGGLTNVDPLLLEGCGHKVKGGQGEAQNCA